MDCLPEHPGSFLGSAKDARVQVEDCIECGKLTALSRCSVGSDPSEHYLV